MFKHPVVGRLGLFVSVLVLANACAGGEIDDAPGGARLGPEVSPLVCPGASPDVSAQSGWRSHEAPLPADGALRFELKARPTAANLEGIVAVGAEDIDDFPKAAIAVRFTDNGLVDVRDGAFYSSDLAYPWDPGVWYSIAISADIDAETYDVEIGPCGEPRQKLIEDASFRDDADVSGQLSTWAVWSYTAAPLEVSTPAWMNSSGGCTPATCLSLGHVCGAPQDGCGGVLSCGVCGDGEMCSSGTCINASPPPLPPPTGTPYGHVTPADVGVTVGVGVVAPIPTATYTGPDVITTPGTLVENVVISLCPKIEADNVTFRNVIMRAECFFGMSIGLTHPTGEYINNITVEYSKLEVTDAGKVVRINTANNVTIRNNEILGGQDFFWICDGDDLVIENNYIHTAYPDATATDHADGFQFCGEAPAGDDIYIRGNWIDLDNDVIGVTDLVNGYGHSTFHIENNYLAPWGWKTILCWGYSDSFCIIRNNVYAQEFKDTWFPGNGSRKAAFFTADSGALSTYECNRYEDGTFIEQDKISDDSGQLTHVITGCPSYP